VLHFPGGGGDVHMKNIVKYTDYKQFRATSRIIYDGQDITNNRAPDADQNKPDADQNKQPASPANSPK